MKIPFKDTIIAGDSSLYRYDSTGRLVHYGLEGEVLENDSTFQITDVQYKNTAASIPASKFRLRRIVQ